MSSPLYNLKVLKVQAPTVQIELSIIHPDVEGFGTDRMFAWLLLSDLIATDDGTPGDDVADAARYIQHVELSEVKHATVTERGEFSIGIKPNNKKLNPSIVYTVTLSDPALLADLDGDWEDDCYQYVDGEKSRRLAELMAAAPQATAAVRRLEVTEGASKFWQVRLDGSALHLAWGKIGTAGQSQTKEFATADKALAEHDKLIAEKLKKGYAEVETSGSPAVNEINKIKAEQPKGGHADVSGAGSKTETSENKRATRVPVTGKEKKSSNKEFVPPPVKTFEDFRDAAIALGQKWGIKTSIGKERNFSVGLLSSAILKGQPEVFLEFAIKNSHEKTSSAHISYALFELERNSPGKAAKWAKSVLDSDNPNTEPKLIAASILASYAPDEAERWEKTAKVFTNEKEMSKYAYFAALGKNVEAREGIDVICRSSEKYGDHALNNIAYMTNDRSLAGDAIRASCEYSFRQAENTFKADLNARACLALIDLGEHAYIEALLLRRLKEIEELTPSNRDLYCRDIARIAGTVGRVDLAFKAVKLAAKADRQYSARSCVSACVRVGDWGGAMAALELVPDDSTNGRVKCAMQDGLRDAGLAYIDGPRAFPLRCMK